MARDTKPAFGWDGGVLCLDFANTVDWRTNPERREDLITAYGELAIWAERAGVVPKGRARELGRIAERRQNIAADALRRARELREAIYGVFSALAAEQLPPAAELVRLERFGVEAVSRMRLRHRDGKVQWEWIDQDGETLEGLLWPLAKSATDLLTSGDLRRVRECAAEGCGWLFLDTSRNHRRRWCDMTACGNRAKVRRFYHRARIAQA